ncbi:hypothetical protein [Peterkaempfera sp. SMS 1(5)a]|uniref:hypothetical protein n=1 Tax=Peterkaempfera podocarpi TaxID=3232308 RepID=UPI00366B64C7
MAAGLCAAGKVALPDVSAVQATYPKVTDGQADYALQLLPAGLAEAAGVTVVESGTPSSKIMASVDNHGKLVIRAGTNVAPAEIASSIVFNLTAKVLAESNKKDPTLVSLDVIVKAVAAVTADTYLRIAQTAPAATSGDHAPGENTVSLAVKRVGRDPGMLTGLNVAAFASHPAYWTALAKFMGPSYYRRSPIPDALDMDAPVSRAAAPALTTALASCS